MASAEENNPTLEAPVVDGDDQEVEKSGKQDINPWSVSGEIGEDGKAKAIDYDKLINEFGTTRIDDALLQRFEQVTGHKPHRFLRRQIFFSHRELGRILDRFEKVIFRSINPITSSLELIIFV